MRNSGLIMEEIKDIEKIINTGNQLKKKKADDYVLNTTLEYGKARYNSLLVELREAINYENRHSIQFIIKNVKQYSSISINRFFDSILSLQGVFEQISKVAFHQEKDLMQLSFNTIFPGSFGVQLSTTFKDNELISKTYAAIESTFKIFTSLNDDNSVISVIKNELHDKRILSKFRKFYGIQASYSNDIELIWGDTTKYSHTAFLTKERMSYIAETLTRYEDTDSEYRTVDCVIKGISLIRKKVEMEYNNRIINAKAGDELILSLSGLLNKMVKLNVLISKKINEMTDDVEEKWEIIP
jgi:hypothetical protein